MKLDSAEVEKLARLAEERGGRSLGIVAGAGPVAPPPGRRHAFTVWDWRPATVNELTKRGNHFSAARRKKSDREAVALAAENSGLVPLATTRRRVSVEVTLAGRMRRVDPDAIWKSLLDALVAAQLLVDDSASWVELGEFTQVPGPRKATKIILEDMEGD